jgi:magnesium transporter
MSQSKLAPSVAAIESTDRRAGGDEEPRQDAAESTHSPQSAVLLVKDDIEELDDAHVADVPAAINKASRQDGFVWVALVNPDEDLVTEARETLGIHPVAAADVVSGRQQPKVQKFSEHLFVLLWQIIPREESSDIELGQTFLYIGEGWLLTVQRTDGDTADLRRLVMESPVELRNSPIAAAYVIMADIVDGYAKAAADVESDLEELEEQVFTESTTEDHRRIYRVRKNIGRIDRAVSSIAAALRESTDHLDEMTIGNEHVVPYLHDLLDDAAGTAALINNQSRALDAILSSHENNVSARQNKDMRTISAFAALLALPTLIAGLYGMNFKNLPLVQWQFGWLVIAAAMVTVDIIIYVLFKRRGWL